MGFHVFISTAVFVLAANVNAQANGASPTKWSHCSEGCLNMDTSTFSSLWCKICPVKDWKMKLVETPKSTISAKNFHRGQWLTVVYQIWIPPAVLQDLWHVLPHNFEHVLHLSCWMVAWVHCICEPGIHDLLQQRQFRWQCCSFPLLLLPSPCSCTSKWKQNCRDQWQTDFKCDRSVSRSTTVEGKANWLSAPSVHSSPIRTSSGNSSRFTAVRGNWSSFQHQACTPAHLEGLIDHRARVMWAHQHFHHVLNFLQWRSTMKWLSKWGCKARTAS